MTVSTRIWFAQLRYIKDKANDVKPFFIYWATYTQQLQGSSPHFKDAHVDPWNAQASMMAAHGSYVTRLLKTLEEQKVAENTLVVWMSDNGPMYAFYPNSGYSVAISFSLHGQKVARKVVNLFQSCLEIGA